VLGVVARASALDDDARVMHPFVPMPATFHRVRRDTGDVLARFEVRCDEVDVSLRLLSDFVSREGPLTIDGPHEIVAARGTRNGNR